MGQTDQKARWRLTDTLSVPVTVLQVLETEGRAHVLAASGEKWVPLTELDRDPEGSEA
jgi:hypothetical protein